MVEINRRRFLQIFGSGVIATVASQTVMAQMIQFAFWKNTKLPIAFPPHAVVAATPIGFFPIGA